MLPHLPAASSLQDLRFHSPAPASLFQAAPLSMLSVSSVLTAPQVPVPLPAVPEPALTSDLQVKSSSYPVPHNRFPNSVLSAQYTESFLHTPEASVCHTLKFL